MGRPREFDPADALEKAMHLFWENGYESTSMSDLVASTGVHRGSLYATYGNKEEIFLAALKLYGKTHGLDMILPILESDRPIAALKRLIWDRYDDYVSGVSTSGCLICNTLAEITPEDETVFGFIGYLLDKRAELFAQALERAKELGQLKPHQDPVALGRYLNTFLLGVALQIRLQPDNETMRESIEVGLAVLD
ncbi:MAG: TetR family transcriptional regulator [Acidobacteria bacterium]|nr:TetR family transcriptional regulator [Acidobacteriota bacterium]NIM63060.1 TetR family transcriptional regulator [Acidobacteriota bacterium]NIO59937.1 TetR family transcriptional regulator [Acidobacteriota bacterium]NIQ31004.1 TetR family transcriptional regulator [Acidobacteriota bacterium]NIQ86132.1 TetR family transcriptional regulator [Acidobacteriota bacterium]